MASGASISVEPRALSRAGRRNARTLGLVAAVGFGMLGLAYASVPLYDLFCRVTGYGGTTQVASEASTAVIDRAMKIRFDAAVHPNLAWTFQPMERKTQVQVGENRLAYFVAENTGTETVVGTAAFNVTPAKAGQYFNKLECFCFTEQVLRPGERLEMPVSYFLDPDLDKDRNLDDVTTVTLSYTFMRAADQSAAENPGQTGARVAGN
ncbi:MAG: cytochrome c oxidase assembly protein [Rhodospirillaceae bacterium]|jgi:cytochrome c oxidase assembly protein subunit 11|nr:cytochrome c oxidase assembly protein [Rhodospirillaceae bacterium]MBT5265698.1 cytochrome c oxidase assembly protein [Rhodospirillaceae bacterium]MBT6138331.1 cytochrome c oxidase assembly protein [Rhodospirillaceae bacterium]